MQSMLLSRGNDYEFRDGKIRFCSGSLALNTSGSKGGLWAVGKLEPGKERRIDKGHADKEELELPRVVHYR